MQETLVVTLGVAWVAAFAHFVADAAGLIPYDVGLAEFAVFLGIVYFVAYAIGSIRYR